MSRRARLSMSLLAVVATAVFAIPTALSHGGNSDPNAIHACVNRVGEVRILGFIGTPASTALPVARRPLDESALEA